MRRTTQTLMIACCLLAGLFMAPAAEAQRLRDTQPARANTGQAQGPLPPIRVEPSPFDAGRVGMEEIVEANFRLTNTSRQTMIIDAWRVSCKCTAPTISDRVIPSGGSVEISATVDVRGTIGDISKSFFITLRGYERELPLTVNAVMGPKIDVQPTQLRSLAGTITLTPVDGRPFEFIGLLNENAEYTATKLQPVGDAKAMAWRVQYRLPAGAKDTCLVMQTDHPEAEIVSPRLFTPGASSDKLQYIMPEVRTRIWNEREHAVVGVMDHGDSYEFACRIRRMSHEPVTVSTDAEGVKVELVRMEEPGPRDPASGYRYAEYVVRVTNESAPEGVILAPLFFTDDEGYIPRPTWMIGASRPSEPGGEGAKDDASGDGATTDEEAAADAGEG